MEVTTSEFSALDYIRIIWRRKWLVIATAAAAVAVSLFFSIQATRIYSSTAKVLFDVQDTSLFQILGNVAPDASQIATQEQVITSPAVETAVAEQLGSEADAVTDVDAKGVANTRVLEITVKATSPQIAAKTATLYATTYQQQRREEAISEAINLSAKLQETAAETKRKVDTLDGQLTNPGGRSANELSSLRIQRDAAQTAYILYQQKADEASVDAAVLTGGVQVLVKGEVPTTADSPRPRQSAALAFALGLLLGITAAIALDFLDDSVKDMEEIERLVRPLPILGAIPAVIDWKNRDQPRLVTIEDPTSNIAETYRSLRTSVQFAGLRNEARVLQVSSSVAAEGKTTTIANLAVTLALAGLRVTVVDCDLRRPRIHEFFGLSNEVGFTSVLLGDRPLSAALQRVALPSGATIQLLPSGPLPPNPAELLGTTRVGELIASLRSESDFVLLDAPPVLPVTDAIVLSSRADGVMMVATARVTGRRQLSQALAMFRAADSPLMGMIVNGASTGTTYQYYYNEYKPRTDGGERSRMRTRA